MASVEENASIRSLGAALSPPERGEPVAGRPVVNLSFAINYALHGLDVRGYHVVNIAIHIGCALLLFGLVRRTGVEERVACAAALVWVVHPLLTEAVNYISQRTELLMSLFYLLTLYASARAHARVGAGFSRLAVIACALGMACKETMVTAPVAVVLYDRVFRYASLEDAFRARWPLYAGLAATWVLLAALIWSGPRWESAGFSTGISVWTYLLNQTVMLVEYLTRAVWPVSLVLDYGEPRALTIGDVLWQGLLVVALLAAAVVALVRWPRAGFAAAAFFIILAPTTSIVPIATEVGAERRMYLPLAALITLVVTGTASVGRACTARRMAPSVLVAVCLVLGALTVRRNVDYRDEMTLWRQTLERYPHARAHRNYATLLKRAGYKEEVIAHMRQALEGHPEGRYALGFELYEQGRLEEAVEELRRFVREVPGDPFVAQARNMTGEALMTLGRYAEAVAEYESITAAQPQRGAAWSNLGMALARTGNPWRALAAVQRAVELEPGNGTSRANLAALLLEAGDPGTAVPHAAEAARLNPSSASARFLAGLALSEVGRTEDAAVHLQAVLQLDPSNADARALLAELERRRIR
ncbi:MAG: tetratricopeptide repeat protein [Acidimicrobiia bacterium]|nr:tetratricopeptide repeat protein [Acidimicrobiia bacterium]